jgi:putative phage-type endonuclease
VKREELDELVRRASIPRAPVREDWLAQRAPFVGASESAALFGEHPFLSIGDLWAAKVEHVAQPETRAMARGNRLEAVVAQWYADEIGVELVEPAVLYVAIPEGDELGVLCATLDREIVGTYSALEVKTSAAYVHGPERYWYWQAQAQMLCAELASVHFAVLDATLDLQTFTVEPDYAAQAELLERARVFLGFVRAREMPPDAYLSRGAIQRLYPDPKPEAKELDGERVTGMLRRLAYARKQEKAYHGDAEALSAQILFELGDVQDGTIDGKLVVHAPVVHASDIDTKRLRAELPEIAKEYTKARTYRKVLLK